jgi:hypothetical protein
MIWAHLVWQDEAAPIQRQLDRRDRSSNPRALTDSEAEVMERRPELDEATAIGIRAWNAVSTCRSIGFGLGPIPQTAIDAWCDRRGLDLDAADFLSDALRYVDGCLLEREASKQRTGA